MSSEPLSPEPLAPLTDDIASATIEPKAEAIIVTLPRRPISVIPIQLDFDPTALPPTPTAGPSSQQADPYENNYDFDHASPIPVGAIIDGLNFVCPGEDPCADNDFFEVTLTGGMCYRVATANLTAGLDTNVIVYGPQADQRPILGGNDNREPGDPSSEVFLCLNEVSGSTNVYVVVGNRDNKPSSALAAGHSYSLRINATGPAATPTAVPIHQPDRCPLEPTEGKVVVIQRWGLERTLPQRNGAVLT